MSNVIAFECPRCGAPIQAAEGQYSIKCQYCGGTVVVPPELRPPPQPQPQPQAQVISVVVNEPPLSNTMPVWTAADVAQPYVSSRRRSRGCVPILVMLAVLALLGGGVFWFINTRSPYFFDNLMAGGFARVDQTFGAQVDGGDLFQSPMAIAVDDKDNIFVMDDQKDVVARFGADGTYASDWRVGGKDKMLEGLAAGKDGSLFVVQDGQLLKYDGSTGDLLSTSGIPDIFGVGGLCALPDGTLLGYADGSDDALVHFDANGTEIGRANKPISEATADTPPVVWETRMAADKDGNVYLLSIFPADQHVYVYGPDLKFKTEFGVEGDAQGQLNEANDIAVDSKSRVYIADTNGVQVFDNKGSYIGIIRLPFTGVASGIAVNSKDELFVVSRSQDKVYKFVLNAP